MARYKGFVFQGREIPDLQSKRFDKTLEAIIISFVLCTSGIPALTLLYQILPNSKENFYSFYISSDFIGRFIYAIFTSILILNKITVINFLTVILVTDLYMLHVWVKLTL